MNNYSIFCSETWFREIVCEYIRKIGTQTSKKYQTDGLIGDHKRGNSIQVTPAVVRILNWMVTGKRKKKQRMYKGNWRLIQYDR